MNHKKGLQVTILSLSIMTVMASALVSPALGAIYADFSPNSEFLVQLVMTIPSIVIVIIALNFSKLTQRFSMRSIAILGLILYTLAGLSGSLAPNIYLLLLSRLFLGIGVGLILPLSTGLIAFFYDKEKQAQLMGYASSMNALGAILATVLSGFLVEGGWRKVFLLYLLGLIPLILVLRYLPKIEVKSPRKQLNKDSARRISPYLLAYMVNMLIFYVLPTNFSIVMTDNKIMSSSQVGIFMASINIFAFIAGMVFSQIKRRFVKYTKLFSSMAFFLGFFLLNFIQYKLLILLGLLFVGLGRGIMVPLLNASVGSLVKKEESTSAMALMNAMNYIGQFLSPLVYSGSQRILSWQTSQSAFFLATIFAGLYLIYFTRLSFQNDSLE